MLRRPGRRCAVWVWAAAAMWLAAPSARIRAQPTEEVAWVAPGSISANPPIASKSPDSAESPYVPSVLPPANDSAGPTTSQTFILATLPSTSLNIPTIPSALPAGGIQGTRPSNDPVAQPSGKKSPTSPGEADKTTGTGGVKEPSTSEPAAKKNPDPSQDNPNDKEANKDKDKDKPPKWYNAHAQATVVTQQSYPFRSPYEGPLSLRPRANAATTETSTLYLAARPFRDSEIIFNPEIAGGAGISGTSGLAGFPNGEATRVGVPQPTPYFARLFWKQTIGLGGETEVLKDEPNQIAGTVDVDRITIRLGKMAATDLFDDNAYSHDPRTQFLNWSLMYNGAWDYPANVRGYTYGGGIELNRKDWTLRYGIFAEPALANGAPIDPHILKANGHAAEFERRFKVADRPGSIAFLAYVNNAHMGNYREAIREMPAAPDITLTRSYRAKYGFGVTAEQELSDNVGLFGRAGWNDGQSESWAFTEIDRTVAMGLQFKGVPWHRPADRLGVAIVANGLSNAHRDYLAAGGLGFIVGDGRLHYAPEEILELYYNLQIRTGIVVTLDLQGVDHPGYNQDRGPVAIAALRVHFEY